MWHQSKWIKAHSNSLHFSLVTSKGPVSKYSPILRHWKPGLQHLNFEGGQWSPEQRLNGSRCKFFRESLVPLCWSLYIHPLARGWPGFLSSHTLVTECPSSTCVPRDSQASSEENPPAYSFPKAKALGGLLAGAEHLCGVMLQEKLTFSCWLYTPYYLVSSRSSGHQYQMNGSSQLCLERKLGKSLFIISMSAA